MIVVVGLDADAVAEAADIVAEAAGAAAVEAGQPLLQKAASGAVAVHSAVPVEHLVVPPQA